EEAHLVREAAVDVARELGARGEEADRAIDLERKKTPHPVRRTREAELRLRDAEAREVLERHVEPPARQVDGEVLPEVRELESRADVVREGVERRVAMAEQAEDEPADRIRGAAAVAAQVFEGRERAELDVAAERGQEVPQRLDRKVELGRRRA